MYIHYNLEIRDEHGPGRGQSARWPEWAAGRKSESNWPFLVVSINGFLVVINMIYHCA